MGRAMTTRANPSDLDLLDGLRRCDAGACAELVRRHAGRMYGAARRLLRDESAAREAVQDAFASLLDRSRDVGPDCEIPVRLHRATLEAALSRLNRREPRREEDLGEMLPGFDDTGHHARPVGEWRPEAVASLASGERRDIVRRAIERLPSSYRTVLLLRDVEERSTEETARLLGTTTLAVRVRLHRARQAVRTLLEPAVLT